MLIAHIPQVFHGFQLRARRYLVEVIIVKSLKVLIWSEIFLNYQQRFAGMVIMLQKEV